MTALRAVGNRAGAGGEGPRDSPQLIPLFLAIFYFLVLQIRLNQPIYICVGSGNRRRPASFLPHNRCH